MMLNVNVADIRGWNCFLLEYFGFVQDVQQVLSLEKNFINLYKMDEELKKLIRSFLNHSMFRDDELKKLKEIIKIKELGELSDENDLEKISKLISGETVVFRVI